MRLEEKQECKEPFSGIRYGYEGITAEELEERRRIEAGREIPGEMNWRPRRAMEIHPDDLDILEAISRPRRR